MHICIPLVSAQSNNDVQVEWAAIYGDGTVVVHVSTPRGTEIETAQVRTEGGIVSLSAPPIAIEVTHWLVLDAGQNMVDSGAFVQNGLGNFIRAFELAEFGFITYDSQITFLTPAADAADITTSLDAYDPQDNPTSCIYDALAALANIPHSSTRAWRVLLIAGTMTDQLECEYQAFIPFGVPIDVLALTNDNEDDLRSIAQMSDGVFARSAIQQLQARLNDINTRWSRPIYRLSSLSGMELDTTGQLFVRLTNGRRVTVDIEFVRFRQLLPDDSPYYTPTPIATVTPTATPIPPTMTPQPTATPSAATDTPAPTSTSSATSVLTSVVVVIPATQPVHTATSIAPSPTPTSDSTEATSVVISPTDTVNTPDSLFASPTFINNVLIGVGGAAVALVVVFVIYGLVHTTNQVARSHREPTEESLNTDILNAPIADPHFYEVRDEDTTPRPKPKSDTEDLEYTEVEGEGDEEDGTQVWTMDDLQAAVRPQAVATLMANFDDTPYDITRPSTMLGSAFTCQIVLEGDVDIAQEHILFDIDDEGQVTATALSNLPVYVNGVRLTDTVQLRSGDVIQLSPNLQVIFTYVED